MTDDTTVPVYDSETARRMILEGTLAGPCHVGGYLYLYGCTGLTALPEGLSVGGYLNLSGCTELTMWGEHPFNWRVVDGYSMLIESTRTKGLLRISRARWLHDIAPGKALRKVFIVEQGEFAAHGDTIASAVADLRFKIAQVDFDAEELIEEIARRGTVTRHDFRLLTGACEAGLREGMREAGLDPDAEELPLAVVKQAAHGEYGYAFMQMMENQQ